MSGKGNTKGESFKSFPPLDVSHFGACVYMGPAFPEARKINKWTWPTCLTMYIIALSDW